METGADTLHVRPGTTDRVEVADAGTPIRLLAPDGTRVGDADLARLEDGWRLEIRIEPPADADGWRGWIVRGDCRSESGRVIQAAPFAAGKGGYESVTVFPSAWLEPGTTYAVRLDEADGATSACGPIPTSVTGR